MDQDLMNSSELRRFYSEEGNKHSVPPLPLTVHECDGMMGTITRHNCSLLQSFVCNFPFVNNTVVVSNCPMLYMSVLALT